MQWINLVGFYTQVISAVRDAAILRLPWDNV